MKDNLNVDVDRLRKELEQAQRVSENEKKDQPQSKTDTNAAPNDHAYLRIDSIKDEIDRLARQLAVAEAERDRYKALLDEERIAADKLRIDR